MDAPIVAVLVAAIARSAKGMTQFFEVETGTEPSTALEKRLLITARAVV
jgi:hypothetical protein